AVNTKIDKHQDELYGGKTSDIKELKQLQKVIELLKKDRDKVEEELLVLMDEEDNIKERLSKAQEELNIAKEQLQERKIEISQQEKAVNARIEKKGRQREEIATKITDNELMKRYQILWEGKEGEVVVEIDSATCSGCNLSLPSDVIYHLQRDDVLITCPNCNRILIWKK
ncbi:MAG: C4-type zinc ribbon domain-containing protein, partial [Atribacterota bacterium]|nr:C4-type zinc ribbon domain-containing protein [Atribacterota bacterium]